MKPTARICSISFITLGVLAMADSAHGAVIFSNPITGTNPNTDNPFTSGQIVDSNLTVSGIGRGSGINGTDANNRYNANSWNVSSLDADKFFTFTLTPDSGYEIDFTDFVFNGQASTAGPTSFAFRSSLDGFTSDLGTPSASGATIDLSTPVFQGIDSAVEFRLYGWGASGGGGTFSVNDFTFNGLVGPSGYYWVGDNTTLGGAGTWANTGGTSWQETNDNGTGGDWDPARRAVFGGASAGTVTVDGTVYTERGMRFTTTGYELSGGTINLNGAVAINNNIATEAGVTATIGSTLAGSNGMTASDAGTLILLSDHTYTGGTVISGGTLQLGNGTTSGSILGDITNNAILAVNNGSAQTMANPISGTGSLVKLGDGNLTLTGTNIYSGGTTVSAGTLTGNVGSLQGSIVNNAALTFDQSGAGTFDGQISGTGSVAMIGSGILTLGGQQSFTGGVAVSDGELRLGSAGGINQFGANAVEMSGSGTLSLNGHSVMIAGLSGTSGTVQNDTSTAATLTVNQGSGSSTFDGTLTDGSTGSLTLRKSGGGSLVLGGNNAHSGGTELRAGTLTASHSDALGTGTATVTNGNLLADGGLTISNPILVNPPTGQVLVAGWDFQTTANGGTAVLASPDTPTTFVANFGEGSLFLNGSNGSSSWGATQLNGFSGTVENVGPGFSTETSPPAALALVNESANGQFAVFRVDMSYLEDLAVSYATQRTNTGFDTQAWSFSTDGVNWTTLGTIADIPSDFETRSLSSTSGLDGTATAFVRLQVDGASSANGNNRLDNIQFNANATALATIGSQATSDITTFSGDVTLDGPVNLTSAAGGIVLFSGTLQDGANGSQGITTVGGGTVQLTAANTYSGPTTIEDGRLTLTGDGGIASSSLINIASGAELDVSGVTSGPWELGATTNQRLEGNGTITGDATIAAKGTHAPTGNQQFSDSLTYDAGSIFEWSMAVDTPSDTNSDTTFASVDGMGYGDLTGSDAAFQVVLADGQSYGDAFWTQSQSWAWDSLFSNFSGMPDLASIFSSLHSDADPVLHGSFSLDGSTNSLQWTPIPEPGTALVGILLVLGMLRRRRS